MRVNNFTADFTWSELLSGCGGSNHIFLIVSLGGGKVSVTLNQVGWLLVGGFNNVAVLLLFLSYRQVDIEYAVTDELCAALRTCQHRLSTINYHFISHFSISTMDRQQTYAIMKLAHSSWARQLWKRARNLLSRHLHIALAFMCTVIEKSVIATRLATSSSSGKL